MLICMSNYYNSNSILCAMNEDLYYKFEENVGNALMFGFAIPGILECNYYKAGL